MKIKRMKINGIQEPIGYFFETVSLSWNVVEATGSRAEHIVVEVSESEDFKRILFHTEGKDLSCEGVKLDVLLQPRTSVLTH